MFCEGNCIYLATYLLSFPRKWESGNVIFIFSTVILLQILSTLCKIIENLFADNVLILQAWSEVMKTLGILTILALVLLLAACSEPLTEERFSNARERVDTMYNKASGRCPETSPEFGAVERAKSAFDADLARLEEVANSATFNQSDVGEARENLYADLGRSIGTFDKRLKDAGCRPWHHWVFE